jgi:hypothetical protein
MNTSLPNQPLLADRFAESIQPVAEATTDPFFYTRLMAKRTAVRPSWQMPVKPAWVISALFVLLLANGWLLFMHKTKSVEGTAQPSGIAAFASAYDLNTQSNY